jgi:hypothetical protein
MYEESNNGELFTAFIQCDARKGSGICQNRVSVTMGRKEDALALIYQLGFRLCRGHQVCGDCAKKKIVFPRKANR